jgi:hypothetical protein
MPYRRLPRFAIKCIGVVSDSDVCMLCLKCINIMQVSIMCGCVYYNIKIFKTILESQNLLKSVTLFGAYILILNYFGCHGAL